MLAAEFFAGMGLVRYGLDRCGIETVWANDIDETKASLYRENFGPDELQVGDIRELGGADVPTVDLATASFPCVDLSLAGHRAGLNGERSGVIFDFCRILDEMGSRAPGTVMIENVTGFLTSNGGRDFADVNGRLGQLGYALDHACTDASAFVPQSRPRVFMVGSRHAKPSLPRPPEPRNDLRLASFVEKGCDWWSPRRLAAFLLSLSDRQAERVADYQARRRIGYHGAFRRTRNGRAVWEVRADEKAGALRTARGGSAKQAMLRAGRGGSRPVDGSSGIRAAARRGRSQLPVRHPGAGRVGWPAVPASPHASVSATEEVAALYAGVRRALDAPCPASGRRVGDCKHGVYLFYDYDGEPIYVGQTTEKLRTRIRRHLTNQRTDAVAMRVLDPFEVAEIEMWPFWDIDGEEVLDRAEFTVYTQALRGSRFNVVLNEGEIAETELIDLPHSVRETILPAEARQQREHPDIRIARRARTIADLARVISEREVQAGIRRTLLAQAKRLEWLAEERLRELQ